MSEALQKLAEGEKSSVIQIESKDGEERNKSEEHQQPLKRRKTGWDREHRVSVTVPISAPVSTTPLIVQSPSILTPPVIATNYTLALQPPPPVLSIPNAAAQAHQTAQEIAAKLALQQQLLAKTSLANLLPQAGKPGCRIYVGSLHYDLVEADVIALFSSFGKILRCDMTRDTATGKSKGFCFLEFDDPLFAEAAMCMNGFDVAGRKIKVGRPTQNVGTGGPTVPILPPHLATVLNQTLQSSASPVAPTVALSTSPAPPPGPPPTNFVAVYNVKNNMPFAEVQDLFTLYGSIKTAKRISATKLDPSSFYDILLEFNDPGAAAAAARTMNGHAIAGSKIVVETISLQGAIQLMIQKVEQAVLTSVLLEDMITLEDTKDPDLENEIKEEAEKFGRLVDIKILKEDGKANVKLFYHEAAEAVKAQKSLNGRGFAGRRIKASLVA